MAYVGRVKFVGRTTGDVECQLDHSRSFEHETQT